MTDVTAAVADAHRREWATVLAATVRAGRDLDLAEECVQEAYASALTSWREDGVPGNPAAWLTTAARRRVIDAIRRQRVFRSKLPLLLEPDEEDVPREEEEAPVVVPDERLRLIFMCCHPAVARTRRRRSPCGWCAGCRPPRSPGCSWCRSPPWRPG